MRAGSPGGTVPPVLFAGTDVRVGNVTDQGEGPPPAFVNGYVVGNLCVNSSSVTETNMVGLRF